MCMRSGLRHRFSQVRAGSQKTFNILQMFECCKRRIMETSLATASLCFRCFPRLSIILIAQYSPLCLCKACRTMPDPPLPTSRPRTYSASMSDLGGGLRDGSRKRYPKQCRCQRKYKLLIFPTYDDLTLRPKVWLRNSRDLRLEAQNACPCLPWRFQSRLNQIIITSCRSHEDESSYPCAV